MGEDLRVLQVSSLPGGPVSRWGYYTPISHLQESLLPPPLWLQWYKALVLVTGWEFTSPSVQRDRFCFTLSLLQLVSSYLQPNIHISHEAEHFLPAEDLISVSHTSLPNPLWPGLVLSPHDISGCRRCQGFSAPHHQPHSWGDVWTLALFRDLSSPNGSDASREVVCTHLLPRLA